MQKERSKKTSPKRRQEKALELSPETIEFTKEFNRFRNTISVEVKSLIKKIDE
jgi:hypothetical protein